MTNKEDHTGGGALMDARSAFQLYEKWRYRFPQARLIGDSTQITYAGNLLNDPPAPGRWFNSATGYGTLGYGLPAAIGAALATPDLPAICLIGDGGMQFTLPELGALRDCQADVACVIWNNHGYKEIENFMKEGDVDPIGVTPTPPDFQLIAQSYGLPAQRVSDFDGILTALTELPRPCLIEFMDE